MAIHCGRGGMADALGWGPSRVYSVEVQVLSTAFKKENTNDLQWTSEYDILLLVAQTEQLNMRV